MNLDFVHIVRIFQGEALCPDGNRISLTLASLKSYYPSSKGEGKSVKTLRHLLLKLGWNFLPFS
jgi:hypothetical protein